MLFHKKSERIWRTMLRALILRLMKRLTMSIPRIEEKNRRTNYLIGITILVVGAALAFVNDTIVRPYWPQGSVELRLLDHLLAGFCIPLFLHFIFNKFYYWCGFYLICSALWEFLQLISRGFFQLDQFIFDLIGISLSIFIYKKFKLSSLNDH